MKLHKALWVGSRGSIVSVAALAFSSGAFAAESSGKINVSRIQSEIARQGAQWTAAENPLTRLPMDSVKRMLGLGYLPKGGVDFRNAGSHTLQASAIDWRNKDGADWIGGAMNQGNCGSCVAFSSIATFSAQYAITNGLPWLNPTFSPQALFACGGGGCESGWMPGSAARYLKRSGVPDEACMPYTSGSTGEDVACSAKCSDADQRSVKLKDYKSYGSIFGGASEQKVKAALANGPMTTTLTVYADFMTYSSGVYKHVSGEALGGHAVSLIGYDDAKNAWLIRNSWGPEWGEHGFAWVSYDDTSGVAGEAISYQFEPETANLSVQAPADREIVSDRYEMKVQGNKTDFAGAKLTVFGADHRAIAQSGCQDVRDSICSAGFDTRTLPDGRYEVVAEGAATAGGNVKSVAREFFVLNNQPAPSISFAADGVDLAKPLKDRPEFIVTSSTGPVPFESVEFRVYDLAGKIVDRKSNPYALPRMKMGWRTLMVPNGKYQIGFYGQLRFRGQVLGAESPRVTVEVKN